MPGEEKFEGAESEYIGTKKEEEKPQIGVQPERVMAPNTLPAIYSRVAADGTTGRTERRECVCMFVCVCVCVYVCNVCCERLGLGRGVVSVAFTRGGSSCSLWFFLCSFDHESWALEESLWQPSA